MSESNFRQKHIDKYISKSNFRQALIDNDINLAKTILDKCMLSCNFRQAIEDNNIDLVKTILDNEDNEDISNLLLEKYDVVINKEYLISQASNLIYVSVTRPDILKLILDSDHCTESILFEMHDDGIAFWYACKYNIESTKHYLKSKKFSTKMLTHSIDNNFDPFIIACKYQKDIVLHILNSRFATQDAIIKAFVHTICLNCDTLSIFLNHNKFSSKTLLKKCKETKATSLNCACVYNYESTLAILNSDKCSEKHLLQRGPHNRMNSIMYMISYTNTNTNTKNKFNLNNLIDILNHPKITQKVLEQVDNKGWNILRYVIRFLFCDKNDTNENITILNDILNHPKITEKMIYHVDKIGWNILMQSCRRSEYVAKYILQSKFCSKEMFYQKNNENNTCLMIASRYNINLIKDIIEHELCDEKYILSTNNEISDVDTLDFNNIEDIKKGGKTFLHYISIFNPQFLIDNNVVTLFNKYEKLSFVLDNANCTYITYIAKKSLNLTTCNICLESNKFIAFKKCGHTCCTTCVERLICCHICRSDDIEYVKIYL
jgi:hypothetical protein